MSKTPKIHFSLEWVFKAKFKVHELTFKLLDGQPFTQRWVPGTTRVVLEIQQLHGEQGALEGLVNTCMSLNNLYFMKV